MRSSVYAAIVAVLVAVVPASAQSKPVGLFDCGNTAPGWAQFCNIGDNVADARFVESAQMSDARGLKWILALGYYEDPSTPILEHAQRVLDRLRSTGLLPHVVAFALSEEWYERCFLGEFSRYGLPANSPACTQVVRDWLGYQQGEARKVLGIPSIWITSVAGHPAGSFRPIPPNTDYVAIDAYIPEGGTFDEHVAPVFAFAEQSVEGTGIKLVQVPPWFSAQGYETPSALDLRKYAIWAARPAWAAVWGFTWQDRPALGMFGLESLHDMRALVAGGKRY